MHFEDPYFSNNIQKIRLLKDAVPTLFLPESDDESEEETPKVQMRNISTIQITSPEKIAKLNETLPASDAKKIICMSYLYIYVYINNF